MAQFEPAIAKTLEHEGGYNDNPITGEVVNHGITVWTLRRLYGGGGPFLKNVPNSEPATQYEKDYIRTMTPAWAEDFYGGHFWHPYHFADLQSQPLADKVFDVGVNIGPNKAIRRLQEAHNLLVHDSLEIACDGILGPLSIAAINKDSEPQLLAAFRNTVAAYYRGIVAINPEQAGQLDGWLARLAKP